MPWKEGETKVGAHDLRRRHARTASRTRATRATCCAARSTACATMGFDTFNVGPELEYFLFEDDKGTETLDEGGYFAHDDARRRDASCASETVRALEYDGHPDRVRPPRGRPVAARDRHALRAGARDGRPHAHLPADRQGDREEDRLLRDVHAEADLRRERLRDAHAPVALHRRRATRSSTRTTSGTCPTPARRSSPGSCATRARSRRCSRSG